MKNVGVAVVTGAGSGLGRHITLALAGAGWRVAAAGRRIDALEATAQLAREFDGISAGSVLPVATDVTDPESVAALFAVVELEYGRLDLLVNNAGTGPRRAR